MYSNVVAGHVGQPRCSEAGCTTSHFPTYRRVVRTELAGGIFHVTMRGNARATIFHDDRDYEMFLRRVDSTVNRFRWLLHAYCVLPNHFHLLVETPEPNLGKGMLVLNGSYARRYNARDDRVGHVFQTPYRSKLVGTDEHFVEAIRYIANNPVKAGLCRGPSVWRWSSYRTTAGYLPPPSFLSTTRVRGLFVDARELRAFVAAGNHVARHGWLDPREAVHRGEELLDLLGAGFARDAVADVLVEDLEGERLEGGVDGADLRQDVDAVAVVLQHLLDPAHLPLDPVEPLDERLLVLRVAVAHRENVRSRSEFETTKRDDPAIAAAATIGLSTPATASGIAATL
jgi:REP element-mobilizing transposase RayT